MYLKCPICRQEVVEGLFGHADEPGCQIHEQMLALALWLLNSICSQGAVTQTSSGAFFFVFLSGGGVP